MKRTQLKIAIVAFLLVIVGASLCMADDLGNRDPFPRMPRCDLQTIADQSESVIDLGWQVYTLDQLILFPNHNGKTFVNGYIRCNPLASNKNASIAIVRKLKWFGIQYPDGPINLTFENCHFDGGFDYDCGLQAHNELVAEQQGRACNIISTITYGIESLTLKRCTFSNCGNSGVTANAKILIVEDCRLYQISKHGFGIRGASAGGNVTNLKNLTFENCGNALDFHDDIQARAGREPHIARAENLLLRNMRGRTKLNDSNLDLTLINFDAQQDDAANLDHYPALDVVMRPRALKVTGFNARNYWAHGIRFAQDTTDASGPIDIVDGVIDNSLNAMTLQQPVNVELMTYRKCNFEYRVQGPVSQDSNVTAQVGSDLYWAQTLDACEYKMAAFNAEHGTAYVLSYWIPNDVLALMESK